MEGVQTLYCMAAVWHAYRATYIISVWMELMYVKLAILFICLFFSCLIQVYPYR